MKLKFRFPGGVLPFRKPRKTTLYAIDDGIREPWLSPAHVWREYKITIILFLAAMLILAVSVVTYAQKRQPDGAAALRIGSRVPDLALSPVLNGSAGSLRLSDFADRLLVIDFWATSCGTCIADMPSVAALQKRYAGKVKVVYADYEDSARVEAFYRRRPELKALGLPVVTGDRKLGTLFPHRSQPHVVWIDHGVFIAATEGDYFTSRNIDSLLLRGHAALREKADVAVRDYRLPVFGVSLAAGLSGGPVFSSCFTGHVRGMESSARLVPDSVGGGLRFFLVNQPVLNLYGYILHSPLPLMANRRVLAVRDKEAYVRGGEYMDVWDDTHTYSFEATAPAGVSREQILAQLRQVMEADLGIIGGIEERETEVLALRCAGSGPAPSRYAATATRLNPTGPVYLRHIDAAYLTELLNTPQDLPFIVDETGLQGAFDLEMEKLPESAAEWRAALAPYGLQLVPARQKLPVFVLTEKKPGDGMPAADAHSSNANSLKP